MVGPSHHREAQPQGYGIPGPQPAPADLPLLPGARWCRTPHHPSRPPVPTAAPRNVAVHGATATQLDVTWEPPPLESQNGDIQGYKVQGPRGRGARLGGRGRGPQGCCCPLGCLHTDHSNIEGPERSSPSLPCPRAG